MASSRLLTAPARRLRAGGLALALLGVVTLAACSGGGGSTEPSTTTSPPESTTTTSVALEGGEQNEIYVPTVGDCFDRRLVERADGSGLSPVVLVLDCSQPHAHEVYAVLSMPGAGATYPEDEAMRAYARSACLAGFEAYVGAAYEVSELDIDHYIPSRTEWDRGARSIGCSLVDISGERLTGSARGSAR